jgi:leucyl-tRNA synthetase
MPIQAAANKLKEEMANFGCPPVFPAPEAPKEVKEKTAEELQAAKAKGKKSKLVVKGQSGPMRQWDILTKMVPVEEIKEFSDPMKWLNYFPPLGVTDLAAFGTCIDWRRSFITTSVNPSYDAFIRWQFNRLYEANRIKSGFRPNVYSPKDGQVCADHDRSSGEGVVPQEYTLVKLEVVEPFPANCPLVTCAALAGKKVYLCPATLRPETMYGQTNCFVLPEGEYGAFEFKNDEVFIISERSAIGLAHQDSAIEWGKTKCLLKMTGQELLGLALKAPYAVYEKIYTLPLLTISMGKGTGVVTSVPSDAPDDYAALKELQDKPLWREKFGLTAEMVDPFEVVPIIDIPGYGDKSAVTMCERLDIKSSKDAVKLKMAKDEVYLKGFYEGVMLVGECKGMKVQDAKPIVRKSLLEAGLALPYFEPENTVMSRSGDECVVALTDQWYLSYGDPMWQKDISDHIHGESFNGYNDGIMEAFDNAIAWLKEWACSREFGLGTQLPWESKWVIDSLSDSTIYMAYYTIAHHLHGGPENMAGTTNPAGIDPADLTDEVFSYIFLKKPLPAGFTTKIPMDLLDQMRKEFEYWYPMDLRVSAKDLIPNHLTMCLYNHAAIWKDQPEMWPRGIYCNGHIMVDAEKMAKSKGNFLMLLECCEEYSTDATRFALADAGDSLEDANFDRSVANQAVSYLFTEEEWVKLVLQDSAAGKLREGGELYFMDRAFSNEVDYLIEATHTEYSKMCYRDGIHRAWFDMINCRDLYRDWAFRCDVPLHKDIVMRFIEALVLIMQPIIPHWSENIWELIGGQAKFSTVCDAAWPTHDPYSPHLRKEYLFFKDFVKTIRLGTMKLKVASPKCANIFLASTYEPKKVEVLKYLQSVYDIDAKFPATLLKDMKAYFEADPALVADTKVLMQFGAFMRDEALERGEDALAIEITFEQKAILEESTTYLKKVLDLQDLFIYSVEEAADMALAAPDKKKAGSATPGKPAFSFFTAK